MLTALLAGSSVPTGTVVSFGGASAPSGWLLCNGQAVSTTTYSALNTVLGGAYNNSPGGGNFNVPDLRTKFPLGKGGAQSLGQTGGQFGHSHTVDPPNTTSSAMNNESQTTMPSSGGGIHGGAHNHDVNIASFGSGTADPPFVVLNFIIKT